MRITTIVKDQDHTESSSFHRFAMVHRNLTVRERDFVRASHDAGVDWTGDFL
jgi:hypothetical protein